MPGGVVDEYEAHLRRRGRRPRTIDAYRTALAAFTAGVPGWREASTLDLERWLDGRRLGPAARAWWVAVLRGFYGWALDVDAVERDPSRRLVRPAAPDYRPRPASNADVAMILELAGGPMRRAVALMVWGGLRCCEVAALRWRDVDVSARAMYVEGKGGRVRWLPMHPALIGELAGDVGPPGAPVLGVAWSADHVSRKVRAHVHALGLTLTAHQLRHAFATATYRARRDLLATSRLLGHRNVATTTVYVEVDEARLRAVVDAIDYPTRDGSVVVVAFVEHAEPPAARPPVDDRQHQSDGHDDDEGAR